MDSDKIFKYGGFEGKLDLADYIDLERWELALDKIRKVGSAANENERASETMKRTVLAIAALLDDVFPDQNASNLILGSSTSVDDAMGAYDAILQFTSSQNENVTNKWKEITNKYAPNREQRRAKK